MLPGMMDVLGLWLNKPVVPEEWAKQVRGDIETILKHGVAILVCTAPIDGEMTDGTNPNDKVLDAVSEVMRKMAGEFKVPLADVRKAMMDYLKVHNKDNKDKGILTTDGWTLNEAGKALVAKVIAEAAVAGNPMGGKR